MSKQDSYSECRHIKRTYPEHTFDEEVAKQIGMEYRTLPSFEKGLYEHLYTKHYSLQRNDLLKCRWAVYKKNLESRVFAPFQFPDIRHLHFHNGSVKYAPLESITLLPDQRMKLRPGPGVDSFGQIPIPQELLMKRGRKENKETSKKGLKKANDRRK